MEIISMKIVLLFALSIATISVYADHHEDHDAVEEGSGESHNSSSEEIEEEEEKFLKAPSSTPKMEKMKPCNAHKAKLAVEQLRREFNEKIRAIYAEFDVNPMSASTEAESTNQFAINTQPIGHGHFGFGRARTLTMTPPQVHAPPTVTSTNTFDEMDRQLRALMQHRQIRQPTFPNGLWGRLMRNMPQMPQGWY